MLHTKVTIMRAPWMDCTHVSVIVARSSYVTTCESRTCCDERSKSRRRRCLRHYNSVSDEQSESLRNLQHLVASPLALRPRLSLIALRSAPVFCSSL